MILKASRISTKSGSSKLIKHVFDGADNERIDIIFGSSYDVQDAFSDARRYGYSNAVRHVKLSPAAVELTDEQAIQAAKQIAIEFEGDPVSVVVVRHVKPRADQKSASTHFHIMIPEFNHQTGKVMDSSWMYPRHEKLARLFEAEFGDTPVIGRFSKSVKNKLVSEQKTDVAEAIPSPDTLPVSAYTTEAHQAAKRDGVDLAKMKHIVSQAWNPDQSISDFQNRLSEHGLRAIKGEKSWIVETINGQTFIGSLDRLTKSKKGQVEAFFNKPEILHIEQDIAKEKNHVRKSESNSRNNKPECVEATPIVKPHEGNREEISPRVNDRVIAGINQNNSQDRARPEEDYQAFRYWFEERIIRNSYSRYCGMLKSLIKIASGEEMSLIFNKDGLIMKAAGKGLSRLYNRGKFIVEAIAKTKTESTRDKYILEADKLVNDINFPKNSLTRFVLSIEKRELLKAEGNIKFYEMQIEAHKKEKPDQFLTYIKRISGWKKGLKTLERKLDNAKKKVEKLSVKYEQTEQAVGKEADEIYNSFQALRGNLQKVADVYRVKEPVTESEPPAPEPDNVEELDLKHSPAL